jgi:methionine biosynthesis protein MetW
LKVIADLVGQDSTLLDVGCGEGDLLSWLYWHKKVEGRGMELSQAGVNRCVARGLSVIQGDADIDLGDYPDQAYDYAVLSQTLQTLRQPKEVLKNLTRIAKHAIVSVPNFGHWKNRFYLVCYGRMPVTRALSYQWYDTPNIHFCTIRDFVILCEEAGLVIEQRLYVSHLGETARFKNKSLLANLRGEQGVFMLRRADR